MFKTGVVSVTFRSKTPEEIIRIAKDARLDGIEWGGDVHCPAGELENAKKVGELTRAAGLEVISYGSYYRCDGIGEAEIIETAEALGAPNIRIWAGKSGSGELTDEGFETLVGICRGFCDKAKLRHMSVSFEWHGGTATDTCESALRLIKAIDRPNVSLYWQPCQYRDFETNLRELEQALPYVSNAHVFAWNSLGAASLEKFPLSKQYREWSEYVRILRRSPKRHSMLLEFVPRELEDELYRDAYTLRSLLVSDLMYQARSLGYAIPYSSDVSVLSKPVVIGDTGVTLKNALTNHPMEGFDANLDGSPSELSERRYERFAKSGVSLIWYEAIAVQNDAKTSPRQLMITRDNLDSYKRLNEKLHELTGGAPVIAQLTHSGRFSKPPVIACHNPVLNTRLNLPPDYPTVTDDYLDRLRESFVESAAQAKECGFDGVDIKACHRYLMSELLSAYQREGRYGGDYENRTRLLRETVAAVRAKIPEKSFLICSRFGLYDAISYPYGFGVDKDDYRVPDLSEPFRLLGELYELGLRLVDVTMGTPYFNPHVNRPYASGGYIPPENPLAGVERLISYTAEAQQRLPGLTFIGTGYSFLGAQAHKVAAGAVLGGGCKAVGFGRMAFAYDTFASDMLADRFDESKACVTCGKCTEIMRAGGTTGCPVRDGAVYAPIYRKYCLKK